MQILSRPVDMMLDHYSVVVIGSGYGGAITAARIARAGCDVCILERGRELHPGEFPNSALSALRQIQVHTPEGDHGPAAGLFDFHLGGDISVLVGCGLGGTSLIDGNVALEPGDAVFSDERWPEPLRNRPEVLRPFMQAARNMLGSNPYPTDWPSLPKLQALDRVATRLGREVTRPDINVTFADGPNAAGIRQNACTLCGDCCTGCNYGAKNTVLLNYLPDARQHGAHVFTEVAVRSVERWEGKWRVIYDAPGEGQADSPGGVARSVLADAVVLAAGTLGTTQILLRSRDLGLPVSDRLGYGFSGNGDVIAFGYDTDAPVQGADPGRHIPRQDIPDGPATTGLIDLRGPGTDRKSTLIIEDGRIPGMVASTLPLVMEAASSGEVDDEMASVAGRLREFAGFPGSNFRGSADRTVTYLVMSTDDSGGRIVLDNDRARVTWPEVAAQPAFARDNGALSAATEAMSGAEGAGPLWAWPSGQSPVTVHPLGGCVMADDAAHGVVDHRGRVFDPVGGGVHAGLYVCDGSVVPTALDVNPLLTISGIAERTATLMIEERGLGTGQGPAKDAELLEEAGEIRALAAAGDYRQAEDRLIHLMAAAPHLAGSLRLELSFISLPDPDRLVVATAWSAIAAGRSTQSLLSGDDASPLRSSPDTPGAAPLLLTPSTPTQQQAPAVTVPRRSSQRSGAVLEQATVDLFARFFAVDPDAILGRLRRQGAGAQFGHDIEVECTVAGSPAMRCHVECKNLDRRVTVDDIAGKLAQQKYHHRGAQVDHWILISPHHDVANDLPGMLDAWDRQGEYPFSVQVWSPETRVREMFALEPAVYQAVYGRPPTREEVSASAEAAELIRQRLTPRLRVDPVWRDYLDQPGAFCFVNEDSRHFDGLYGRYLPLKAADERGGLLDGTLTEQVISWAGDGGPEPMLLLADFGEGKSVFTYCLTRQLAEEFRAAPDGSLFPLRIPLREFREADSARGLLERRLNEIGATLARWRALTKQVRTLAILDGFDEMSADLSPAAITANLRDIRSCLTELSSSKILVTSRQRVLDGSRDWKRTLDRLGRPRVVRIASAPRPQRVQYLEQFATDGASARVLANLRGLYDPIGLAAKPLFLEMIKETLRDLPDDAFSEMILYDTYINKSLRTKWELLADPGEELTSDELIENLMEILEDVAVRLQEVNGAYLYLRDYEAEDRGKIAELLWKMRDQAVGRDAFSPAAHDDAVNRVGIRSLLKAVPAPNGDRWPVDFFHRSMREYFMARSITRSLTADAQRARQILSATPLLPEIAHFAGTILRSQQGGTALAALEKLARSAATDCGDAYLGGNALTLLHAAGSLLAGRNWSGLRLDHARLQGADLRRARFAGSSLRYANLDNADLQDADLKDADLEGVHLEETSQVLAVTAPGGNRIIAAYEDRSLREWSRQPGAGWGSRAIVTLEHQAERLQVTPLGRVLAYGEGMLSVLDVAGSAGDPGNSAEPDGSAAPGRASEAADVRCAFRMSPRCRTAVLGARTALFTEEGESGQITATWLDMATARVLSKFDTAETLTACTQLDGALFALATSSEVHVVWLLSEGQRKSITVTDRAVTCLAVRADRDGALLAAGHHDGTVSLTRLSPADTGDTVPQRTCRLHDGPVTDILLDEEEQVITGSTDRSVCVTPLSAIRSDSTAADEPRPAGYRLHLTLRCKGVRFDGVRTEREQEKLRQYAEL